MPYGQRDSWASSSTPVDVEAEATGEMQDPEGFARNILVQRLTARAQSRGELAEALAKKHVPEAIAEVVLTKFEKAGLIDDEDFARSWVEQRQRSKGLSKRVLELELRRKGVDDDITREVLDEVDPELERQAAHQLVQKKLRSMRGLDETVKVRRLTGMLARKGYAPQVAFDVVREELGADPLPLESM